jgi:tricorn protease-like protein
MRRLTHGGLLLGLLLQGVLFAQSDGVGYIANYFQRDVSQDLLQKLYKVNQEIEGSRRGDDPRVGRNLNIWKLKADLSEPPEYLTISADLDNNFPRWSPDGRFIAYVRGDGRTSKIWIMEAGGANQRKLTQAPGSENFPLWSPDGKRIAFMRGNTLMEITVPTGEEKELTSMLEVYQPCAWSKDGRSILLAIRAKDDKRSLIQFDLATRSKTSDPTPPSTAYKIFTNLKLHPQANLVLYHQFMG